jgi:hypothetical protein
VWVRGSGCRVEPLAGTWLQRPPDVAPPQVTNKIHSPRDAHSLGSPLLPRSCPPLSPFPSNHLTEMRVARQCPRCRHMKRRSETGPVRRVGRGRRPRPPCRSGLVSHGAGSLAFGRAAGLEGAGRALDLRVHARSAFFFRYSGADPLAERRAGRSSCLQGLPRPLFFVLHSVPRGARFFFLDSRGDARRFFEARARRRAERFFFRRAAVDGRQACDPACPSPTDTVVADTRPRGPEPYR